MPSSISMEKPCSILSNSVELVKVLGHFSTALMTEYVAAERAWYENWLNPPTIHKSSYRKWLKSVNWSTLSKGSRNVANSLHSSLWYLVRLPAVCLVTGFEIPILSKSDLNSTVSSALIAPWPSLILSASFRDKPTISWALFISFSISAKATWNNPSQ